MRALLTSDDRARLSDMITRLRASGRSRFDHLAALEYRLAGACIVQPGAVPDDVVTLNTRVVLQNLATRRRIEVVLADPDNVALFGDQMSVAAPCGTALLGRRSGDVVTWTLGTRQTAYLVERVLYQPEAAGDFHL